jgi:alkylation response protein AidB-like acyl-CoA dehydrogenase
MDLNLGSDDEAFRNQVREWVRGAVPADMARRTRQGFHTTKDDLQTWNRILYEKGWAAPHWPKGFGGTGWPPLWIHIFEDECAAADAPFLSYFGLRLIGPLIYTYGSEAQKLALLDPILSGSTFWCQGFSEPESGSDLRSVRTTARREADAYVIDGQKIWTTEAHFADRMFCLARTDPDLPPQKGGLSILLLHMDQPGVTVRPIITIDGGHSVNEVFLDGVRVPVEDVVGEPGRGWEYTRFMLGNERVSNAHAPRSKRDLELVRARAEVPDAAGARAIDRPDIQRRLVQLEIDICALEWSVLRVLDSAEGTRTQAAASGLKIAGSEIQQRLADLAYDLLGPRGIRFYPEDARSGSGRPCGAGADPAGIAARQLFFRATTIYAGSNEIQRGIIARQVFGL